MLCESTLELLSIVPAGTVNAKAPAPAFAVFLTRRRIASPELAPVPLVVASTFPSAIADCSVTGAAAVGFLTFCAGRLAIPIAPMISAKGIRAQFISVSSLNRRRGLPLA
jgi:hypothetical protein